MTLVVAAQYATALAGLAIAAAWAAAARRGSDPLGPVPEGRLPDTGLALFVAMPAWFLATLVLGAVARSAGLSGPMLATAAALVHTAIGLALLPRVLRGAPEPALGAARIASVGVLAGVATFGLVGIAGELTKLGYAAAGTVPPTQDVVEIARRARGLEWVAMLVTGVVLAPFGEEIFWRGTLLPALARVLPVGSAIVLQGLAFGAVHFVFGAPVASWPLALPLALVGVLAGWVYVRTASLPAAVLVHAVFNGLNLLFLRLT